MVIQPLISKLQLGRSRVGSDDNPRDVFVLRFGAIKKSTSPVDSRERSKSVLTAPPTAMTEMFWPLALRLAATVVRPCWMVWADIGCSGGTLGWATRSRREAVSLAERQLPIVVGLAVEEYTSNENRSL